MGRLLFRRRKTRDADVEREIAFHVAELTEANIAAGMTPAEAHRRAMIEFGGAEQVKQTVREVYILPMAESVLFNLKAALRFVRKRPSFSAAVILTLALGIGANSAVFSAIDAILLRPLPFPDGDRIIALNQHNFRGRDANHFVAPVRLEDWNRMNSSLQAVSGYYFDDISETSGDLPERVMECLVAPRFLEVMGVRPELGRGFFQAEEHWGGPSAALISYSYWQRRFHGDASVLGRQLRFGKWTYTVVGVMPATFQFPESDVEVWTPSALDAPFALSRDSTWFNVIGRMKPNLTIGQTRADLAAVQARLGMQFGRPDSDLAVDVTPLKDTIVGEASRSLWLLYGSVTLLLAIACSNIAALLLARQAEREQEISIRFSLGASRSAIVLQLLSEVFALALMGSLAGLVVAAFAVREFRLLSAALPRTQEIVLNGRMVLYALAAGLATTFLCGLIPALRGTRRDLARSLAAGSRTQVSTRWPLQWLLAGVQVALAVTLLVGAGLLLRSFQQLARVHPGFDSSHVLTFQISGSWGETSDNAAVKQRIDRTLDTLRSMPGVESAATAAMLPGIPAHYQLQLKVDGKDDADHPLLADTRYVSADYFSTMHIAMLFGDNCKRSSTTTEVMVNRSFADRFLAGGTAVGHVLAGAAANSFLRAATIKGVVADVREEGVNEPPVPTAYFCTSAPSPFPNYLVRISGDPMAMAETIRQQIHSIEPSRPVYGFSTLQDHMDDASSENRLRTILLTAFAATAVALACIGLYGTLSYLGRLRQREVGVRLALGAMRNQIVARFLSQGLRVAAAGCAAGLLLGLALSHFLTGMLYGIGPLDPTTYVAVAGLILLVSGAASLIPAVRAARVEPVRVLRED